MTEQPIRLILILLLACPALGADDPIDPSRTDLINAIDPNIPVLPAHFDCQPHFPWSADSVVFLSTAHGRKPGDAVVQIADDQYPATHDANDMLRFSSWKFTRAGRSMALVIEQYRPSSWPPPARFTKDPRVHVGVLIDTGGGVETIMLACKKRS